MKTIDVIIPVRSDNEHIIAITQMSIDSLRATETEDIKFNVIICEQIPTSKPYENIDLTLHYDFPFNYNRVMNYGASFCSNKYIMFCNNDLVYIKGFAERLVYAAECGYESLSPADPAQDRLTKERMVEGYGVQADLKGYCIFVTRDMFERIGGFDTSLEFWYSDHLYKDQLIKHRIKHVRVTDSYVIHCHHCTLKKMDKGMKNEYTEGQRIKYYELKNT